MSLSLGLGLGLSRQGGGGAPAPFAIADQALAFGALTLEGAGGVKPVTSGTPAGAYQISGGQSANYSVDASGFITPASDGAATDGDSFTYGDGTTSATITIAAEANTYSYRTLAEMESILALSDATLSGKTIAGRHVTLTGLNNGSQIKDRNFTSTVRFTGMDEDRPVTWDGVHIRNSKNVTVDHIRVVTQQANGTHLVIIRGPCEEVVIEDNYLSFATEVDPRSDIYVESGYYWESGGTINGVRCIADGIGMPVSFTIQRNEIYNTGQGLNLSLAVGGTATVKDNIIDKFWIDAMLLSAVGAWVVTGNDISRPFGNSSDPLPGTSGGPHCDGIQFAGAADGSTEDMDDGITISMNRIVRGASRGTMQGIYLDDIGNGYGYKNVTIESNVISGVTNTHGISVRQAAGDVIIRNNTVQAAPESTSTATIRTGASAADGLLAGTNYIYDNICEAISSGDGMAGGGTMVSDGNIEMGYARPNTTEYELNWVGPTFNPQTIAEAMTQLDLKSGGPADSGTYKAGAIGTGYSDWEAKAFTNPRSEIEIGQTIAYSDRTFGASPSLTIPDDTTSGSVLVAILRMGSQTLTAVPTGWSLVDHDDASSDNIYVYKKIAEGTEGGTTVSWTASGSGTIIIGFWEVLGATGQVDVEFNATTLDPPSITATGGSASTAILISSSSRRSDNDVAGAPDGYSDFHLAHTSDGSTSTGTRSIAIASKVATLETEDPGAFTWTGTTDRPCSTTIAVR